jgi:hypothetical protein
MAKKRLHIKGKASKRAHTSKLAELSRVKIVLFWILSSLIPFALVAVLEISLRISGYEKEKRQILLITFLQIQNLSRGTSHHLFQKSLQMHF